MSTVPLASVPSAPPAAAPVAAPAAKGANAFRGTFLNCYGQLERSMAYVLILAAAQPQYSQVAGKIPQLLGQRLAVLRKLLEVEGPMKAALEPLAEPLAELARFDELRNLMAHAEVETAKSASGGNLYIFRMLRFTKGEPEQLTLAIDHLEANVLNQRLSRVVKAITTQLDTISKKRKAPVHPVAVTIPA
jgi:hypothetical protein